MEQAWRQNMNRGGRFGRDQNTSYKMDATSTQLYCNSFVLELNLPFNNK